MGVQNIEYWLSEFQSGSSEWEQNTRMHLIDLMKGIQRVAGGQDVQFLAPLGMYDVPLLNITRAILIDGDKIPASIDYDLTFYGREEVKYLQLIPFLYLRAVRRRGVNNYTIMFDEPGFSLRDEYHDWIEKRFGPVPYKQIDERLRKMLEVDRILTGDNGARTHYFAYMQGCRDLRAMPNSIDSLPYEHDDPEWLDKFVRDNSPNSRSWVKQLLKIRNTVAFRGDFGLYDNIVKNMRDVKNVCGRLSPGVGLDIRYADVFNLPGKLRQDMRRGALSRRGVFYLLVWALVYEPIETVEEYILENGVPQNRWGSLWSNFCYQCYDGFYLEYGNPSVS